MTVPREECPDCAGTGRYGFRDDDECPKCHGSGAVEPDDLKLQVSADEEWVVEAKGVIPAAPFDTDIDNPQLYRKATLSFGGQTFDVSDVQYSHRGPVEEGGLPNHPVVYGFTCSSTIPRFEYERLLALLMPPTRGATDHVLAKRAMYGGRKGRSAWRRLLAKGYDVVASVDGTPAMAFPAALERENEAP